MKSWIREKKYECGEYRTVGIYAVTDQEHRQRGRKQKESSRGQKARNKNAACADTSARCWRTLTRTAFM